MNGGTYLLLGGAGLVGFQVAYEIGQDLAPDRVVIVSRTEESVDRSTAALRELLPDVDVVGEWGDVFLREEYARTGRSVLLDEPASREGIFEDMLGGFESAYERSHLTSLIRRHRPTVVVDAINTATAISYQDVYTSSVLAKQAIDAWAAAEHSDTDQLAESVETLILSQAVPQLIRHVRILHRALKEAGTKLYLKVGTTGTGGMGLDIPYTHSEDRPSAKLMTKTAVAFAHTGLLFLMARTEGGPVVKEIKPAALIGYAGVEHRPIRQQGATVQRYRAIRQDVGASLRLSVDPASLQSLGPVKLPVVDTGENGVFTKGEFEAITALGQMELVTPEEIAKLCVLEMRGSPTGRDVVGAIDGSVLGPSYRGGVVRAEALAELQRLEEETETHSVALGQLGPPELSKLLWEAELLRLAIGSVTGIVDATAGEITERWTTVIHDRPQLADTITSLGLPVLVDGATLLRGPFIRIPEVAGIDEVDIGPGDLDRWADKGWVDLRPSNAERWQERFRLMRKAIPGTAQPGSAGITVANYSSDRLQIGTIAAWVLANEHGGWRIK